MSFVLTFASHASAEQPAAGNDAPALAAQQASARLKSDCAYPYASAVTQRDENRVLSSGSERWALFDVQTGDVITSGPVSAGPEALDASGALGIVGSADDPSAMQLINLKSGQIVSTLVDEYGYSIQSGVGMNGNYAWRLGPADTTVWLASGKQINKIPASGWQDSIFAAPNELRLLNGNDLVIVSIYSDKPVITPFPPELRGKRATYWFEDGQHYLGNANGHAYIFNTLGGLAQDVMLPFPEYNSMRDKDGSPIVGFGNYYFGRKAGDLHIFRVGGPLGFDGRPVSIFALPFDDKNDFARGSRGGVAIFTRNEPHFRYLNLRGTAPSVTTVVLPKVPSTNTFSSDGAGRWSVAAGGVIYTGDAALPDSFLTVGCRRP